MTTDIAETIALLRGLDAKATPGPWDDVQDDDPRGQPVAYYRALICTIERSPDRYLSVVQKDGLTCTQEQWAANAALMAAMRTHLTALLDAAEAGMRARRVALEDAKAALKDLWFDDEVARPGGTDAMEAIDALIAASPTCNDTLQVRASVKSGLTVADAEQARDAALEEVEAELRAAYVTDEHNTLGFMDALEIVGALRRPT